MKIMKLKKGIFGLLFLTVSLLVSAQEGNLKINEILAGNSNDSQDDFLEYDDWLEIYYEAGSSPAVINLAGYFLSDNPNNLGKWKIPNTNAGITSIVAGQHLLFWIDKDPEQGEDHVDFKFSTEGETIFLSNQDTIIIDSVTFPQQVSDISYGRECDGCDAWVFFNNTTPDDNNGEIIPAQQLVFINEVMYNNESYIDDLADEFEPWIEIYNPNPFDVNLSGYILSNTGDPGLFTFPSTNPVLTVIEAEGYLLVWCDNETNEGENHANFTLNSSGTITLTGPDNLVDSYAYNEVAANHAWGRQSDGSPTSIDFGIPTPRVTNSLVIVQPESLFINELLSANNNDIVDNFGETEDWIEIYNPNNYEVNLAGYYLSDNPENPMKYQIPLEYPDSTTIAPGDWMLFWADEDGSQGLHHVNFRLSNNGEEVTLYSPDGFSQADHIEFVDEAADISLGRETDGSSNWVHFLETTPDASNNGAQIDVSVANFEQQQLFKVWPNPVSEGTIYFSKEVTFELFDNMGKRLMSKNNASRVEVANLSMGIYILSTEEYGNVKLVVK